MEVQTSLSACLGRCSQRVQILSSFGEVRVSGENGSMTRTESTVDVRLNYDRDGSIIHTSMFKDMLLIS